ncbi:hypothetical protein [Anaerosolibacter sp.]|uniref:hypothetical protein n=1 Tax=Anaerosolibacter sp. TaxID=1872527 RepID=UPI0039EF9C24
MKVYFQSDGCSTLFMKDIEELEMTLEAEQNEFYYGEEVSDEQKNKEFLNTIETLESMNVGDEPIRQYEFSWGVQEMTEEEFNELGEFQGF